MSGFEVAGLVLGVIPLLISGLEHYAEGVAVMKNMKQYDCVFADINSSFAVSIGIYTESCYNLLAPLSLPDAQMKTLLMEEDGEKMQKAWKDVNLQQNLTKRLGPHCKTYLSFVVNLNKRILKLAHKLKLGPEFRPPWVSKDGTVDEIARNRFFSSAWVRIRGGFESNKCTLLLQEIDRDISKIAQLTSLTVQVEPLRLIRKRRMKARVWANIRDSAQSLSELLCLRWSSPCSCQYSHRANMVLKAQGDDDVDVDDENEQSHFELLLVFDQVAASAPPVPCRWQDVEIESSGFAQTASLNPPQGTVRFLTSPSVTGVSRRKVGAVSGQKGTLTASKINDLCQSLVSKASQNCCVGFFEDQLRRHHLFLVSGPGAQNQIMSEVSLHYLLLDTHKLVLGPKMKCTFALTLAIAVLQLYDTPWLVKSFSLRDICFLKDTNGNYLLDRPFVSLPITTGGLHQAQPAHRRRLVKNEFVLALGIALLELSYAKPLHDLVEPFDLDEDGHRDSMTEYSTANRLAKEIHLRELPNYAKAVFRCVNCNFDSFSYDLSNQEFRERFYEGVVVPLREDWEYATK